MNHILSLGLLTVLPSATTGKLVLFPPSSNIFSSPDTADSTCKVAESLEITLSQNINRLQVLDTTFLEVGKSDAVQFVTEACTGFLSARGPPWHRPPEQVEARTSCGITSMSSEFERA